MAVATSTALLIGAGVTGIIGGYQAATSTYAGRRARNAQENLEKTRQQELAGEAAAREAARAKAATAGRRVGTRTGFTSGLGFGSGNTAPGLGGGTLFGN